MNNNVKYLHSSIFYEFLKKINLFKIAPKIKFFSSFFEITQKLFRISKSSANTIYRRSKMQLFDILFNKIGQVVPKLL